MRKKNKVNNFDIINKVKISNKAEKNLKLRKPEINCCKNSTEKNLKLML